MTQEEKEIDSVIVEGAEITLRIYKLVAVRFAEWAATHTEGRINDKWYFFKQGVIKVMTTSELYDIFLSEETLRLRSVEQERLEGIKKE